RLAAPVRPGPSSISVTDAEFEAQESALLAQPLLTVLAAFPEVNGFDPKRFRAAAPAVFPRASGQLYLRSKAGEPHRSRDGAVAELAFRDDVAFAETFRQAPETAGFGWGRRQDRSGAHQRTCAEKSEAACK